MAHQTRQSGWLSRPGFNQIALFKTFRSFVSQYFSTNNHTFSCIFTNKELPCYWNLKYIVFDVQYFIPNLFIESLSNIVCFVKVRVRVMVMMFNATFNNISVISWRSVLLVEDAGVPGESHRPVASHWQTLPHKCCIEYTSPWTGFKLTTLVVIGTDCIGSCKSN